MGNEEQVVNSTYGTTKNRTRLRTKPGAEIGSVFNAA